MTALPDKTQQDIYEENSVVGQFFFENFTEKK